MLLLARSGPAASPPTVPDSYWPAPPKAEPELKTEKFNADEWAAFFFFLCGHFSEPFYR
jgi:hypothetical protein